MIHYCYFLLGKAAYSWRSWGFPCFLFRNLHCCSGPWVEKTNLIPSSPTLSLSRYRRITTVAWRIESWHTLASSCTEDERLDFSPNVCSLWSYREIPLEVEALGSKTTENHSGSKDFALDNNLWARIPPQWVDNFKVSNCLILNILVEMYCKSRSIGNLSSILQCNGFVSIHQLTQVRMVGIRRYIYLS